MPDIASKVKAVLKSAELSFELGIINPTRFGPVIHANVPDYAEILLRVFIEDRTGNATRDDFPRLIPAAKALLIPPDGVKFQDTGDYFLNTRAAFRNPLHHTDRVQGYVIEQREALHCLMKFNDLLQILFPAVTSTMLSDSNYLSYVSYLQMEHDESLGRGDHRLYQAVIATLQQFEREDRFVCPTEHDASRLMAVRRLFRYDRDKFHRTVLKYRPLLKTKLIDLLASSRRRMTLRQIASALSRDADLKGVRPEEVEACLQHIEGEHVENKGIVMVIQSAYYLSPP